MQASFVDYVRGLHFPGAMTRDYRLMHPRDRVLSAFGEVMSDAMNDMLINTPLHAPEDVAAYCDAFNEIGAAWIGEALQRLSRAEDMNAPLFDEERAELCSRIQSAHDVLWASAEAYARAHGWDGH